MSPSAFATVTVRPISPYQLVTSSGTNYVHYAADSALASPSGGFMDSGFHFFSTTNETGTDDLVYFDVSSDDTFDTSSSQLVITVTAANSSGTPIAIPIAQAAGPAETVANCSSTSRCQGTDLGYYRAAKYTQGTTSRIGIYLKSICNYSNSKGTPASGCTGDTPTDPDSTPTTFPLTFYVSLEQSSGAIGIISGSGSEENMALSVQLHNAVNTYTCPSPGDAYFPGDKEILVIPTKFQESATAGTSPATVDQLIVTANEGSSVNTGTSFASINPITGRLNHTSQEQTVRGFTNSSTGASHSYTVAFTIRDLTGAISNFAGGNCTFSGVQTADIQGFLKKSNCFIATGAFRAIDIPPIDLLRRFRDQILLQFSLGQSFVNWYYSWSPKAALWLIDHPQYRLPVLRALATLELLAWIALRPALGLVLFALMVLTLFGGKWAALRARRVP